MIQLTIIKIIGYGPWTLTLGSDREHELQILQASLYKELQKLFSEKNSLVFLNRSDEFFVVSNGISLEEHIQILDKIHDLFQIRLSMSIGYGNTPFDANLNAYEGKQNNILLSKTQKVFGYLAPSQDQEVTIIHMDVENITSKRKSISPYETSSLIFRLYNKIIDFFLTKKYVSFFMGGDNFMIIADKKAKSYVEEFLVLIKSEEISLNCGIGTGKTCREAIKLATKSLDTIRELRDSGKMKPEIIEMSCF